MPRLLSDKYAAWKAECEERFLQLKKNEEELNRIFIEIYGLQDELTPDVAEKDVTVHRIFDTKEDVPEGMRGSNYVRTMRDEIVSLISYAVGCMFGRYSLDVEELACETSRDFKKYPLIWGDLMSGQFDRFKQNIARVDNLCILFETVKESKKRPTVKECVILRAAIEFLPSALEIYLRSVIAECLPTEGVT